MSYPLLALILAACRAIDLLSTYLVTPTLKWERNPLIKLMGWRRTLALNLFLCALAPLCPLFPYILSGLSLLAAAWNFHLLFTKPNLPRSTPRFPNSRIHQSSNTVIHSQHSDAPTPTD